MEDDNKPGLGYAVNIYMEAGDVQEADDVAVLDRLQGKDSSKK